MKSNLIISKYKTTNVIGTKSIDDTKTFFGSKMVDIEDSIIIDDSYIQYEEVYDTIDKKNNGYQYYNDIDNLEKSYLNYLSDLKNNKHTLVLSSQNRIDLSINTNWLFTIEWKNILREYLFLKLKESRIFKTIKYSDIISENINLYIRNYIEYNLINRYDFTKIDLYIKYFDLDEGDKDTNVKLSYNPVYDISVKSIENKVSNINSIKFPELLTANYKQTESSKLKMFKYYFDLYIDRI